LLLEQGDEDEAQRDFACCLILDKGREKSLDQETQAIRRLRRLGQH